MNLNSLFIRYFEQNNGNILNIYQSEIGDVGCVVWDAAIVLAKYLETEHFLNEISNHFKLIKDSSNVFQSRKVIELGAGTGIVGIHASTLGADCTITDLEACVPLMRYNIDNSRGEAPTGCISADTLHWNKDMERWKDIADVILLADCVYYDHSIEDLVATINLLSKSNTIIFCAHEDRTLGGKEAMQAKFFKLISKTFYVCEIASEFHDETFRSDDIHIHRFTRRKHVHEMIQ